MITQLKARVLYFINKVLILYNNLKLTAEMELMEHKRFQIAKKHHLNWKNQIEFAEDNF